MSLADVPEPESPHVGVGRPVGLPAIVARYERLDEALRQVEEEDEANHREHLALRERRAIIVAEQRELLSKMRALAPGE